MLKSAPARPPRPWAVTLNGWLILLQAIGLFVIGGINLLNTSLKFEITPDNIWSELPHAVRGTFFIALALFALVVVFHFWRLRPTAWASAMLVQGLTLLLGLGVYLRDKMFYGYLLLAYGIFMVLYLHNAEVYNAFRYRQDPANPSGL